MNDPTEGIRRQLQCALNAAQSERLVLEEQYGQVWNTDELRAEFEVVGFLAPFVVVRRRSDGKKGSMTFQHNPRYYFDFQADG